MDTPRQTRFLPIVYSALITAVVIGLLAAWLTDLPIRGVFACLYVVWVLFISVLWVNIKQPSYRHRCLAGAISFAVIPLFFGAYHLPLLIWCSGIGVLWFNIPLKFWDYWT